MELTFQCPSCQSINRVESIETAERTVCRQCGAERALHREAIAEDQLLACPRCATTDLYIQKDFPQGLGLFIVIVGFVISTVFWYYELPLLTYAVLLGSALLDLVLFYRVPNVTICYRCLSQVRGPGSNPQGRIAPFDLSIGERYRQERIRVDLLRKEPLTKVQSSQSENAQPVIES